MKNIIINLVVGVAMLTVGWFGGVYYQKKKLPTFPGGGTFDPTKTGARNGTTAGPNTARGGLTGEITAKDDASLTIKLTTGSTKTIYYSNATKVYQENEGATSDLAIGKTISVEGAPGNDNNTTAEVIRITK